MMKILSIFAVMMVLAGLCAGCGRVEEVNPEDAKVPKESNAKNSSPEKAEQSKTDSAHADHDHSGHNH